METSVEMNFSEKQEIGKPPIKAIIKELKDFLGEKDFTTSTIDEVGGENRFQWYHNLTRVASHQLLYYYYSA